MIKRRAVIKAIASGGALMGASILMPRVAMAAWNTEAFNATNQQLAMNVLLGGDANISADVTLKTPSIAENGETVPVTVKTSAEHVESISLFVAGNPTPLVAEFQIPVGTLPEVSTRIRMSRTSMITAVVKTRDGLVSASQETKIVTGGCGN